VLTIPAQTKTGKRGSGKIDSSNGNRVRAEPITGVDLIVLELMKKMAKTSETMLRRHANLE